MQGSGLPESEAVRVDEDAVIGDVLRWLVVETEAESAAYILLIPSGEEHLLIEPRGLSSADLAELVEQARHAMVEGRVEEEVNVPMAQARWLGKDGSKIVILRGVTSTAAAEAMRFARFVIEWLATRGEELPPSLERRVREIPGVAWAEMAPGDPPSLRVLLDRHADPELTRHALTRALGEATIRVEEIDAGADQLDEPRIRLVDLTVGMDDESSVDVLLDWRGQTLRGRGRGRTSDAGRSYASAQAVADAMKPLLDSDVAVEGVYRSDASEGLDVLVVTVRVGTHRYVGAVTSPKGQEDVSGARAVLDALNRRLPQIAGKAGRI
ncbi:MAG: hypothetical protein ACRDKA_01605 [Actinomycetota bacterium]